MSIVDQLNEKKRKAETNKEEEEKSKSKKSKSSSSLSEWSADELDKDESKNLQNALKHILKGGVSSCVCLYILSGLMSSTCFS